MEIGSADSIIWKIFFAYHRSYLLEKKFELVLELVFELVICNIFIYKQSRQRKKKFWSFFFEAAIIEESN